ncbi:MAG: hypothetical protein ACI81P_000649 [Neolewinella sp.]|jgi:hypothetical protein
MKNTFSLIFVLLIMFSTADAQSNWKSANLTTVSGKKMVGEVDDRQWSGAIEKIEFRTDKKSTPQSFDVSSISILLVGDQKYIGQTVEFNASPRKKGELVASKDKVDRSTFALLKVLIGGSVELMQFYDERGEDHYFFRYADGTLKYLEYGIYRRNYRDQENVTIEMNGFRSFLLKQFSECNSFSAQIISATYDEQSLIRLFKEFYACTGEVVKQPVVKASSWSFAATVGFSRLSPRILNSVISASFGDLSSTALTVGGRAYYYPSGPDGGSAFHFGLEHFQYEVAGNVDQRHPYKREQTIRLSVGPRFYITKGSPTLYSEFIIGYDLLIRFEQTAPSSVNPNDLNGPLLPEMFRDRNGRGKISMGLSIGVKLGRADLSLRAFLANRNLSGLPKETLYGNGVTSSYSF